MVSKITRITGNKRMIISLGGSNRSVELKSFTLENDDASGDPTFIEAADGAGRDWTANGTYKQDISSDSFANWIYANEGLSVECRYAPMGNLLPTPEQRHYVFTATVGAPGVIGGDADYDGSEFDGDFTWKITSGKPVVDDGTNGAATINTISPSGRSVGQTVGISGTRFTGATAVKFGNTQASFTVLSDNTIAATVPTGITGNSNVTVVTPAGTSTATVYAAAS